MTDVEDCLHANRAQSLGPYHVQLDSKGELMMQSVQMSQHTAVSMPSIMGAAKSCLRAPSLKADRDPRRLRR